MLEKIFEVERYFFLIDTSTGLYTRRSKTEEDKPSTPKFYLGNFDIVGSLPVGENDSPMLISSIPPGTMAWSMLYSLAVGVVNGFTPVFKEGSLPLGLVTDPKEILEVKVGAVTFSEMLKEKILGNDSSIRVQVPGPITKVYRQPDPHWLPYRAMLPQ